MLWKQDAKAGGQWRHLDYATRTADRPLRGSVHGRPMSFFYWLPIAAVTSAKIKSHGGVSTRQRMNQDRTSIFAILAAVAALFLLQAVLWRCVCVISRLGPRLQRYAAGRPALVRATSLRGSFRASYPGPYAVLAARFAPGSATGLPLTLMCLGALYAAALLGGLIDDLREIEGLVGPDHGVNASFAPYRTPSLIEAFIWITALGTGRDCRDGGSRLRAPMVARTDAAEVTKMPTPLHYRIRPAALRVGVVAGAGEHGDLHTPQGRGEHVQPDPHRPVADRGRESGLDQWRVPPDRNGAVPARIGRLAL